MLDVRRLRILDELSRRGTITAVAHALSYSPSAISQQLSTLEREAGVPLLEPVGRGVRLTAQGQLLVQHGAKVLEDLERAEAALAGSFTEVSGTLRVVAFQSAVLALVPAALKELHRLHPDLRVEITEQEPQDALPDLLSGQVDVVIGEEYPGHRLSRPAGTTRIDLTHDDLRLATPVEWKDATLSTLADRPFVMEPLGSPARAWAEHVCRSAGFEPDVPYNSTDLQIHLRLVEEGLAAALLPDLAGAEYRPRIATRPLPGRPQRRVNLLLRRGSATHPRVRALSAALAGATGSASDAG